MPESDGDHSALGAVIDRYKSEPESVYNTWFIGRENRTKAFRSIRRGVREIVDAISSGTFGNDFRGSPLEVVVAAITEQKQVFEGAAHPFYWKPKLRIPDIYENEANQRLFGSFLDSCLCTARKDRILDEISRLAAGNIKGLGPAVANILYFLHPTIVPPSNTAIVRGFNALFGARRKLGSWEGYLAMRETIVRINQEHRQELSKDLGAIAGLLFEVGSDRLVVPGNAETALREAEQRASKAAARRHGEVLAAEHEASAHTRAQHALIRLGRALRYDVFVARNDRHKSCDGDAFAQATLARLPPLGLPPDVLDTVELIDVIWLKPGQPNIVCAFEVEQSTSIYSGILRMKDLARSLPQHGGRFYLVAPEAREREVLAQMMRPALREEQQHFPLGYLPTEALRQHCDAMCTFGTDHEVLLKIARGGGSQTSGP